MEPRDHTYAEVVAGRRSVTAYTGEVVSRDLVRALVEEATLAPSAFNGQPWRFVVAQGAALDRAAPALGGNATKVLAAGTLVAVYADLGVLDEQPRAATFYDGSRARSRTEFAVRNASLAAMTLMLSATSHGLATRPMIGFDPDALDAALEVPATWYPVLVLALGWPADEDLPPRRRVPVDEVLTFR